MKNSYFIIVENDEVVYAESFPEDVNEEAIIGQLEEEVISLLSEGDISYGQTIEICKRIGEFEVEYEYDAQFVKD